MAPLHVLEGFYVLGCRSWSFGFAAIGLWDKSFQRFELIGLRVSYRVTGSWGLGYGVEDVYGAWRW